MSMRDPLNSNFSSETETEKAYDSAQFSIGK